MRKIFPPESDLVFYERTLSEMAQAAPKSFDLYWKMTKTAISNFLLETANDT
jgi:hypothetical protein